QLITLLIISALFVTSAAVLEAAMPAIQTHFSALPNSELTVKIMVTTPALFTGLAGPFFGSLIDRFGRKYLLLVCLALYGIAGSSGLFLKTLPEILVSRILLGITLGGITTATLALICDYYYGAKRQHVLGLQSACINSGVVFCLITGGFLSGFSWRLPFALYLIPLFARPLVIFFIAEPHSKREELQVEGAKPRMQPDTAEGESLERQFLDENESRDRINIPFKQIGFIYFLMLFTRIVIFMVPLQTPFYLAKRFHDTNAEIGLIVTCFNLASILIAINYPKFRAKLSFQGILTLMYVCLGLGYLVVYSANHQLGIVLGLLILGIGWGLFLPNVNVWLSTVTPISIRGKAMGGLTMAMFLGQFISPIAVQPLIASVGSQTAYGVVGGALLIFALGLCGGVFTGHYSLKATA
ncbi:MAG: MFS transporter, partial [Cyanobacteria bacterium P01_H01_bin.121]